MKFSDKVIEIIKQIPYGKVSTYGQIAHMAGNSRGARQVSWILHSSSKKYNLPWHRIINSKGFISFNSLEDKEHQKSLLEAEGITVSEDYKINLKTFCWKGI